MKHRATPYQAFPGWRYHKVEPARIVTSQAQADALGSAWSKNPWPAEETTPDLESVEMSVTDDVSVPPGKPTKRRK